MRLCACTREPCPPDTQMLLPPVNRSLTHYPQVWANEANPRTARPGLYCPSASQSVVLKETPEEKWCRCIPKHSAKCWQASQRSVESTLWASWEGGDTICFIQQTSGNRTVCLPVQETTPEQYFQLLLFGVVFVQTYRKQITWLLVIVYAFWVLQCTEKEGKLSSLFLEVSITLVPTAIKYLVVPSHTQGQYHLQ